MHLKKQIICLLCSIGLISTLVAQKPATTPIRAISFDGAISNIGVVSEGKLIELDIPTYRRSKTIHYTGPPLVRFINKAAYIEGQPLPESLAEMRIPKHIKQPLFLFTKNKNGSGKKYNVLVIEDSVHRLPGGSAMFINLSPYPLVLLLGESKKQRIELKPKGRRIHKFKEGNINLRVRIASYAEDAVRKGIDTRIFPLETHRDLYFIYPIESGEPGRVRMRILRENEASAKRSNERALEETSAK